MPMSGEERGGYPSGDTPASELPPPPDSVTVPVRPTADGGHGILLADEVRASPPPRFLTEDQVRQLLAECVTVVKPGETLILRLGREWTPGQFHEVQGMLDDVIRYRDLPFRALAVPADGLGVAEAPPPRDPIPRSWTCPAGSPAEPLP